MGDRSWIFFGTMSNACHHQEQGKTVMRDLLFQIRSGYIDNETATYIECKKELHENQSMLYN